MSDSTTFYGEEMGQEQIVAFLEQMGNGVLALASSEGDAYSVPISFGYDGVDRIYFAFFSATDDGMKHEYAALTETASLSVPDVKDRTDWRSATVRGPIREINADEWDSLVEALKDNAWYPEFGPSYDASGVRGYVMEIKEVSGVQTGAESTDR